MIINRSKARTIAMQIIFQIPVYKTTDKVLVDKILSDYKNIGKEEAYIREVFSLVTDNIDAIDAELNSKMKGWTIDSIPKVDLAILRLAVAEICYAKDIPKVVAVNEAVRIAKKFSDDKSAKFINGILANIGKDYK